MQDSELRFTDQEISSRGGGNLLKKMLYSSVYVDHMCRRMLITAVNFNCICIRKRYDN